MNQRPLACLLATIAALPAAGADDSPRRQVIEQKSQLVQRVLENSSVAQRIGASGSALARLQLERAAGKRRLALELAALGRLEASEAAIDEAIALIGEARRLAPDTARAGAELRARYEALLQSTRATFGAVQRAANPAGAQLEQAGARIASAVDLAGAQRYDQAFAVLAGVERELLEALGRAHGGTTLDYTLRFESQADEFRHESERFGSFQRLVPIAFRELKPAAQASELAERYVQRALQLQADAGAHSARGDLAAALETLRDAIGWLQRALAAAGVLVPTQ